MSLTDIPEIIRKKITKNLDFRSFLALRCVNKEFFTKLEILAEQISTDEINTLALLKDGRVIGWGLNNFGILDIPTFSHRPIQVICGYSKAAALLKNGQIVVWGNDYVNRVNDNFVGRAKEIFFNKDDLIVLTKDGGFYNFLDVSINTEETERRKKILKLVNVQIKKFVKRSNSLMILGEGGEIFKLVKDFNDNNFKLLKIKYSFNWKPVDIEMLEYQIYVILESGELVNLSTDKKIKVPEINIPVKQVAAGPKYSYALLKNGKLVGWGSRIIQKLYVPPYLKN